MVPLPFPSCLWFGKAACVPPGRLTELPLVKLYLVFLFHLPIETLSVNDPPDVLDRQKCLTALASLRHAKWFQVWILSLFVSKPEVVFSLVLCCMLFFFLSFIWAFCLSPPLFSLFKCSFCSNTWWSVCFVSYETFVITQLYSYFAHLTGSAAVSFLKTLIAAF